MLAGLILLSGDNVNNRTPRTLPFSQGREQGIIPTMVKTENDPLSPPISAGQRFELPIEKLNSQAEGIARLEGMAVFVPGVLPGETVSLEIESVAARFARGRALSIPAPSPHREAPRCPLHIAPDTEGEMKSGPFCGGCQLQSLERSEQLEFKRLLVEENLSRIGGIDHAVAPVSGGHPWGYRNKMSFALVAEAGHLRWGLRGLEQRSGLVPLSSCDIARPELWEAAEMIVSALDAAFGPSLAWDGEKGLVRGVTVRTHTGRKRAFPGEVDRASIDPSVVVLFAVSQTDLKMAERIAEALKPLENVRPYFSYSDPRSTAVYYDRTRFLNRLPGKAPYWGEGVFREDICAWHTNGDWSTLVGPTSFLQVNDEMAERLYGRVLSLPYEGHGLAVDAYCGVGVLTRGLANRFDQVMGIELDTQSIKLARTTARRLNDCRVEWVAEASEAVFGRWGKDVRSTQTPKPDLVVLDPPRKGCQNEVLYTLNALKPKDVVYISCHPAALARDLKILCKKDFEVVAIEPFDLFPQTHHVETLVHLKAR